MGLFSRNESSAGSGRRSTSRTSLSSEAQATEMQGKARRRLIGALALVLAAVIIVPMLFDPESADQASTPIVVPDIVAPTVADNVALAPPTPAPDASVNLVPAPGDSAETPVDTAEPPAETPILPPEDVAQPPEPAAVQPKPADKAAAKPESKPAEGRSDDGSVAIALLEGRAPAPAKAPAESKSNFVLQIAAYGNDKDAQLRRERLVAAGVTNAYVENAVSGGKTTYRLRVGPFPTRDAAQAAQARLRALGYDNGFISTK